VARRAEQPEYIANMRYVTSADLVQPAPPATPGG
jgi:hypothetical protein